MIITAVMVVGVSLSAILCYFVPLGASTTWIMYYSSFYKIRITLNALSGLFNAMVCPGISYIVSKWSPPNERTILTAYKYEYLFNSIELLILELH